MEKNLEPVMAFGIVIKKNREAKGLSQEKLAYESGLDRTFISLLERGLRQPTLKTLFRIASSLQISPSTLIHQMEELLNESK